MDCSKQVPVAFEGDTPEQEARYGTCGNQLFGGALLTDSHLTGNLTITFVPITSTLVHFVVRQGALFGTDGVLSGPLGYSFPMRNNQVSDTFLLSSGDLDLVSGYAINIQWYASFFNTGLLALSNANPKLAAPVINFPGIRGHAWARFTQRSDGLLDFYFRGSTFLPLGHDTDGDIVRFPLPYCSVDLNCASVPARGTSLHPHLYLDTAESLGFTPCAPNCPDLPTNTTQVFTINSPYTAFGDDFDLRIPQLGGLGPGRAELQSRFEIQFGTPTEGTLPFKISAMPPEGLFAEPPSSPLLGSGFRGLLLAANQQLHFPNATYEQQRIVFVDEPFNFAQGMIDLASGQIIGEFEYPLYIGQALIDSLFTNNVGRISSDPFFAVAMRLPQNSDDENYALFEKAPNGQTMFRANLFHHRSFATYCFPQPSYLPGMCWVSGEGGNLNIFVKLRLPISADPEKPGIAVLSEQRTFTSSSGDAISFSFSVPCHPVGRPFSFIYANNNRGSAGTFTLNHLASVSCTTSKVVADSYGSYDQIAVTGFGNWSKDPPTRCRGLLFSRDIRRSGESFRVHYRIPKVSR